MDDDYDDDDDDDDDEPPTVATDKPLMVSDPWYNGPGFRSRF
ncbi:hypothetical protein ACFW04_001090 [Cataglyphis niger]